MTSPEVTAHPPLTDTAAAFAAEINLRLHRIIKTSKDLTPLVRENPSDSRITVGVLDGDSFGTLPLSVDGRHLLDLLPKFNCCFDSSGRFLAVEESWMHVLPKGDRVPLFRYEYLRDATNSVPVAHLQVHAHRDEFAYALIAAEKGKARQRWRKGKPPRLQEFHFPLGGHRFRPCLEDVLHALVVEFCVDPVDGWESAVKEGREQWRRLQLRAAVRDAPEEAAEVLRLLDYDVAPGTVVPKDNVARLRAY
ncbi:hypothetical protein GCM10022251_61220 [Phytohabitans flavus]|uniref:Uncharacterized protein n=1 Tax=Phytohabitans flavus TaxID=1076124 RepID=A0A6F8Y4X8_9ACTN|nr:hypothetical protein [Phytohabitans flavus]BCB81011.1 hypothetical protein Pflav_074210 [Phytohabitans flavus]